MTELEYTKNGDYYIPNLTYPETKPTYGKYGMMREDYLKNHNSGLWNRLILHGELTEHLNEIDRTARERIDAMMPKLTEAAGVTEELKATDPMKWVGISVLLLCKSRALRVRPSWRYAMNNCKAQAEEIVLSELVYN